MGGNTWQMDGVQSEAYIKDPGSGGKIDTSHKMLSTCHMAPSADETRTLTAPDYAGQMVCLSLDNAHNAAITAACAIDSAGNTVMTLADADDAIILVAVNDSGTIRWQVVSNVGSVALS